MLYLIIRQYLSVIGIKTYKNCRDKEKRKGTPAYDALKQIGAIYKPDSGLAGLGPVERQHRRQLELKTLAGACFAWVKTIIRL